MLNRFQLPVGSLVWLTPIKTAELTERLLAMAVNIQRPDRWSYSTLGSKTSGLPTDTQNESRLTGPWAAAPVRFCMSTWVLRVTIRWLGPTAPCVSGGMEVLASPKAAKLAAGDGEASSGAGGAAVESSARGSSVPRTPPGTRKRPGPGMGAWCSLRAGACAGCWACRRANSVKFTTARAVWVPRTPPRCAIPGTLRAHAMMSVSTGVDRMMCSAPSALIQRGLDHYRHPFGRAAGAYHLEIDLV